MNTLQDDWDIFRNKVIAISKLAASGGQYRVKSKY
jgi:hypothetical protein